MNEPDITAEDHGRGGFAFDDPRAHAVAELRSAFADFSRNGRWGTCAACPCDGYGRKLPELCSFTDRGDHQLDIDGLSQRFKAHVTEFSKMKSMKKLPR